MSAPRKRHTVPGFLQQADGTAGPLPPKDLFGPTYPVEVLPAFGRDMVRAVAATSETPLDYGGTMFLAVLATACQRRFVVSPQLGKTWPLSIYTAAVGESGTAKSEVVRAFTRPIEEHERQCREQARGEISRHRQERDILERRRKRAEEKAASPAPDAADAARQAADLAAELDARPALSLPTYVVTDITPEALTVTLQAQGKRIAFLHAEGGPLKRLTQGYKQGPDFEIYKCGWGGEPYITTRVGRAGTDLKCPAITMGLLVQPAVVRTLLSQPILRDEGMVARFLFAKPEYRSGYRTFEGPPIDQIAVARYRTALFNLLDMPTEETPRQVSLSSDAAALFRAFALEIEPRKRLDGDLRELRDWSNKLPEQTARIAALFHLADHHADPEAWRVPIDEPTMLRAITLGEYYVGHAIATFSLSSADPDDDHLRRLIAWLSRRTPGVFSRRDLQRSFGGSIEQLKRLLPKLEERGYVRQREPIPPTARVRNPIYDITAEVGVDGEAG